MLRIKLIIVGLLAAFSAFSQKGSIEGVVLERASKLAVPMADVTLNSKPSGTMIKGLATDNDGGFSLKDIEDGDYEIVVSFVGFKEKVVSLSISPAKKNHKIRVLLDEEATMLKAVEIKGERTNVKMDIDKKVFVMNENVATDGVSVSEALKEIPSVDVDVEGNISLRNSESVEVYINGKASGLTADNRAEILEQMPAGTIDKIEVITNPSSKHDAEGSAGIINIVLKNDKRKGYYGSVSAGASYPWEGKLGGNVGASINYNVDKWTFYGSVGLQRRSFNGGSFSSRKMFSVDTAFLKSESERDFTINSAFLRAGADYSFNENNSFSLSGMFSGGRPELSEGYVYRSGNITGGECFVSDYSRRLNQRDNQRTMFNLTFDYTHKFRREGSVLDFVASMSGHNNNADADYEQISYASEQSAEELYYSLQKQRTEGSSRTFEFQADYVLPIGMSKVEAGYKSSFRENLSGTESYLASDRGLVFVPQTQYFNDFELNQNVHALYFSFISQYRRFSYKAGLRGELTDLSWTQHTTGEESDKAPYFNLFPTAYISYKATDADEIQLSYTRRIRRPRGRMLNPFVNITDSTSVSFGNPNLTPEMTNSLELSYVKSLKNHSFTVSAYYRRSDDLIESYKWMDEDVMKQTFSNLTSSDFCGFEWVGRNKISVFTLTSNINLFYYKLNGGDFYVVNVLDNNSIVDVPVSVSSTNSFCWTGKLTLDFPLPLKVSCQLSADARSSKVTAQGEEKAQYTVNAGLRRTFFDRKVNAMLNVRDIFNSRRFKRHSEGINFVEDSEMYRSGRMIQLNVAYSFGNMKSKSKKEHTPVSGGTEDDMVEF